MPTLPPITRYLDRIEFLVEQIERSRDPAAVEAAREMVQLVLQLHAEGFRRMLAALPSAEPQRTRLLETWTADELIAGLLLLHDLHPQDIESRVHEALEQVRPYLESHGGGVELLAVDDDVVRLRLTGSCQGCPSSTATLRQTVERAIYARAPDVATIEVADGPVPSVRTDLVQIETIRGELHQ